MCAEAFLSGGGVRSLNRSMSVNSWISVVLAVLVVLTAVLLTCSSTVTAAAIATHPLDLFYNSSGQILYNVVLFILLVTFKRSVQHFLFTVLQHWHPAGNNSHPRRFRWWWENTTCSHLLLLTSDTRLHLRPGSDRFGHLGGGGWGGGDGKWATYNLLVRRANRPLTWKQIKILLLFRVPLHLTCEQVELSRRSVYLKVKKEGWAWDEEWLSAFLRQASIWGGEVDGPPLWWLPPSWLLSSLLKWQCSSFNGCILEL